MSLLDPIARQAGADDLFCLNALDPERFVSLDGCGRGAGWAGNLHLNPNDEPYLAMALERGSARIDGDLPRRIFGPYWSTRSVAISSGSTIVVFAGSELAPLDDAAFTALAEEAAALVNEVPMAKRLADQLELAQAELGVTKLTRDSVEQLGAALAEHAAAALSCEFAVLFIPDAEAQVFVADLGWRPVATTEELASAIIPLWKATRDGLVVEQELAGSALAYRPLTAEDGLVSLAAVPLGTNGELGTLVVGHARTHPRGFTSLCQLVLQRIAETAAPVISETRARGSS